MQWQPIAGRLPSWLKSLPTNHTEPRDPAATGKIGFREIRVNCKSLLGNRFDFPTLAESVSYFMLADSTRPLFTGLPIAEAHQKQLSARPSNFPQPTDVGDPLLVRKRMEKTAFR